MIRPPQVIVVGAGPTGLMTACDLQLLGVQTLLLERGLLRDAEGLRAEGMVRPSLELLKRRGLLHALFAEANMSTTPPTELPAVVPGIRQQAVENVLEAAAGRLGVKVLREVDVVEVRQDEQGVAVVCAGPEGRPTVYRAEYVVGCDGGRSTVRRTAGFTSVSRAPRVTGYQAHVTVELSNGSQTLPPGWHRTPRGIAGWSTGPCRVVSITFEGAPPDRHTPVTLDEVERSLRYTSGVDLTLRDARSLARFTDHTLLVDNYREGNVLLAGDAAHVHPPNGGQGLNLGLGDAANLAWKLAAAVKKEVSADVLDTYDAERRPFAQHVLRNSLADLALLDPRADMDPAFEWYREIKSVPNLRSELLAHISMVHMRYDMGGQPDRWHALLGRAIDANDLASAADAASQLLGVQQRARPALIDLTPGGIYYAEASDWQDRIDRLRWDQSALSKVDALLVRPDGYVSWIAPKGYRAQPGALDVSLEFWHGSRSVTDEQVGVG